MSNATQVDDIIFRLRVRDIYDSSVAFAAQHHVSLEDLLGFSRYKETVSARHAYWHWLTDRHQLAYASIARLLRRDHTTIMYGVDKHLHRQPRTRPVSPIRWDRESQEEAVEGGAL